MEQERIIQRKLFVAGNSTEVTPYRDVWKLYEPYGNVLRLKRLDFTAIKRPSLRSEVKYYFCYLFEQRGKVYVPLFDACKLAINTLADIAPEVIYFADITEGHIRTLVLALEAMRKNDGEPLSQYYIAKSVNGLKRIMCYLMSTERDTQIRAPRPRTNPFDIVTFHNLRQFNTPTEIIPEEVVEQRFNGQYVLFIPTWKQNGGWQQPAIRSIHLEDKGIAGYLIGLIKEQQETARQIQEFLPEDKKGMLFSYRQSYCRKGKPTYSTKLCFVASIFTVNDHFRKICRRYNISDETGNVYVVTTHQFRHNGITDRLAAGFTAAQIAEMTGHHGDAMIFNAYAHLNLMPETIREKQNYVLAERQESDKRYVLFGGRILNMDEQMEQRLMKNLRAHRVRGGICSDITTCKSDMWNCLECKAFVADTEQTEYYREQIALWREKQVRFSAFPIICENAKRNAGLFESILKSIETDVQRNEANNT